MRRGNVRPMKKRAYRVSLNYVIALGCIEFFVFYLYFWDFTLTLVDPSEPFLNKTKKEAYTGHFDIENMDMKDIVWMHSKSSYKAALFAPLLNATTNHHKSNKLAAEMDSDAEMSVEKTVQVLSQLGVSRSTIEEEDVRQLPPWSQIVSNYGSEPIIYGLERCQAYRETVPIEKRMVGAAGLFSTGTNVLHRLLINNCSPPPEIRERKFFPWQVPWGKHNPAEARMQYFAKDREFMNQTTVLPVVTVRHPITWLYALCQHSYSLQWTHDPEVCDFALYLKNPVRASFGYKVMHYDSLVDVWQDWYLQYFLERRFPLIMVRLEDVIFRPVPLVEKICNCVGGRFDPSEEFRTFQDSVNLGKGHGGHRSSGLVSTFIKYGKPLKNMYKRFAAKDRKIIKKVLKDDHGLLGAFNYRLL